MSGARKRKWMNWIVASAVGLASPVLLGTAWAQEKPADDPAKAKGAEVKKDEKKAEPPKARIAVIRLAGTVKETPTEEVFNFGGETGEALWKLVERLDKAAGDPAVKAVVAVLDGPTVGAAQVGELRQALGRVKAAGKEVIGHADTISSLGQFALLTGAGRVIPRPKSALERLIDESSGDDDRKGINVAATARPFLIAQALPLVQALDPARAAVVLEAIGRLELIRREGVVLMAPELGLGR